MAESKTIMSTLRRSASRRIGGIFLKGKESTKTNSVTSTMNCGMALGFWRHSSLHPSRVVLPLVTFHLTVGPLPQTKTCRTLESGQDQILPIQAPPLNLVTGGPEDLYLLETFSLKRAIFCSSQNCTISSRNPVSTNNFVSQTTKELVIIQLYRFVHSLVLIGRSS
jgi:hypothetical protein